MEADVHSSVTMMRERYAKKEVVIDTLGRAITVRKLDWAQRTRVQEMTESLNEAVFRSLMLACSVVEIDGAIYPFPRNRRETDSVLQLLDTEGLTAVMEGFAKLYNLQEDVIDEAKKSQETQTSDSALS